MYCRESDCGTLHSMRPGFENNRSCDGLYCSVCGEVLDADDEYFIDTDDMFVGCEYCIRRVAI